MHQMYRHRKNKNRRAHCKGEGCYLFDGSALFCTVDVDVMFSFCQYHADWEAWAHDLVKSVVWTFILSLLWNILQ